MSKTKVKRNRNRNRKTRRKQRLRTFRKGGEELTEELKGKIIELLDKICNHFGIMINKYHTDMSSNNDSYNNFSDPKKEKLLELLRNLYSYDHTKGEINKRIYSLLYRFDDRISKGDTVDELKFIKNDKYARMNRGFLAHKHAIPIKIDNGIPLIRPLLMPVSGLQTIALSPFKLAHSMKSWQDGYEKLNTFYEIEIKK